MAECLGKQKYNWLSFISHLRSAACVGGEVWRRAEGFALSPPDAFWLIVRMWPTDGKENIGKLGFLQWLYFRPHCATNVIFCTTEAIEFLSHHTPTVSCTGTIIQACPGVD